MVKKTAATKPQRRDVIQVAHTKDENPDDATAKELTRPEVQAATVIQHYQGDNHEVNALARELSAQVSAVRRGDMSRAEAMLIAQAHALDEIFSNLARRSNANVKAGHVDAGDRYLRLALKAQSQCRTTLETLAEIKNPRPVAFVKQANIAHGPQQVNNGTPAPAHVGETLNQSNELSGGTHELLPDTRASQAASRIDTPMEAMGEINRAANH